MSQSRTDWQSLVNKLEDQVRRGQFEQVRERLLASDISKCPRSHAVKLGNIARRAQRPHLTLKLLKPFVRPSVKGHREGSAEERLEYACALQRLGAKKESVTLLRNLSELNPARLALAFHHIGQWEYDLALSCLDEYLEGDGLTDYEKDVAQVNRLACLVALEDSRAESLFPLLEKRLADEKFRLLHANTLEIMAQYFTGQSRFEASRQLLHRAKDLMQDFEDVHRLFIEKWMVINQAMEEKRPDLLFEFRQQALKLSHWETLRDLDFYHSLLDSSHRWSDWVYFGTPYLHFRRRLEKLKSFPESAWVARSASPKRKWDPWFPRKNEGEIAHRFIVYLTRDFYRPARIGEIFSSLFPDQFYDVEVSPNRIHQVATRAKKFLVNEDVPARIHESDGAYSLRWPDDLKVHVRQFDIGFTKPEFIFDRFREIRSVQRTAAQWASQLGFNAAKTKRLLKEASDAGLIDATMKGPYSHYTLKERPKAD